MEFVKGAGGIYYLLIALGAGLLLERAIPWRRGESFDLARWLRNASMTLYGTILLGLLPAIAAFGAAVAAEEKSIGLLNQVSAPYSLTLIISVLILDLATYGEHRALHKWRLFWRTHRAHHTDARIDATTALRFHPLETLFRALIEFAVVFAFGLPAESILLIYMIHIPVNVFTHANIRMPRTLDRLLPLLITTPAVHRLHHSVDEARLNKNFGTAFTIWDRLFGTYLGPEHLHPDEQFGLDGPDALPGETFGNLALDPFRKTAPLSAPPPAATDNA